MREEPGLQAYPSRPGRSSAIIWIATIVLVYFLTARSSLLLQFEPEGIAAIWPPAGIFLSAILLTRRDLRAYLVYALLVTDFVAEMMAGTPLPVSIIYAVALAGDAFLGSWLLLRFVNDSITFCRVRDVLGFLILSVFLSNALMSCVAATASGMIPGTTFWASWKWWFASDGVGNLLVTPFIIGVASWGGKGLPKWKTRRVIEGVILFVLLTFVNFAVFHYLPYQNQFLLLLTSLTFPFLMWAALRFGLRGVTSALLVLAAISADSILAGNIFNIAPFTFSRLDAVIIVQLYIALMAIPSLIIVAVVAERGQVVEAVRRSEKLYRTLVDALPDGITIVDVGGRITYVSPKTVELYGERSEEGILGRSPLEWIAPEFREKAIANIDGAFKDMRSADNQYRLLRRDGTSFWGEINAAILTDESGTATGMIATTRDVTDRKQTVESLRLSDEIIQQMPDAIIQTDLNGTITRWARGAEKIFGYGIDEAVGKPVNFIHRPDVKESMTARIIAQIQNTGSFTGEIPCVRKDGTEVAIETTAKTMFDRSGKPVALIGINRDITARKLAEEAARKTQEVLEKTFRSLDSALFILDNSRPPVIVDCNPSAMKIFGYEKNEVLGLTTEFLHVDAESLVEFQKVNYSSIEERGFLSSFEFRMKRKTGEVFPTEHSVFPLLDTNGGRTGWISVVKDISQRKHAERALQERNRFIDVILENAPIGFAVNAIQDAKAVFVSSKFEDIYGVPRGSISAVEEFFEKVYLDPVFREEIRNRIFTDMASGDPSRMRWENIPITTATGERKIVSATNIPVPDQNLMVSTVQDVTERWNAEQALRESEHRFRTLAEATFEGIALTGNGIFLDLNDQLARMFGQPREELIGTSVSRWVAPEHRQMVADHMSAGRLEPYEHLAVRADGSKFPVEIRARSTRIGDQEVRVTAVRDITERKKAEEVLRESEERFRRIFDESPLGISTSGPDFRFIRTNASFCRMMGYTADELARLSFRDLTHPDHLSGDAEGIRKLAAGELALYRTEKRYIRKDKNVIWGALSVSAIRDDEGQFQHFLVIVEDITERKRAQDIIERLNQELEHRVKERTAQLESANKELESFAYSVSHDLRAPLRAIDGYTGILAEEYEPSLDAKGVRLCNIIRGSTQRMGKLIDDLLDFSRLGRSAMESSRLDMETIAKSVYLELASPAMRERITFNVHSLLPTTGDPALMRQVWVNLLSNAIKFSSKQERAIIEVCCIPSDSESIYCVRDNGAGFEMEYAHKLFGVFQRLHSEKEFEGTGVGLAIVQRVVHRHGGRVWAEGAMSSGATFYFALPKEGVLS